MKTKNLILMACAVFCLTIPAKAQKVKKTTQDTVTFTVSMHCDNCKKKIENTLQFETGVKNLNVNLADKTVTLIYDKRKTTSATLKQSIEKLNYTVEEKPKNTTSQAAKPKSSKTQRTK